MELLRGAGRPTHLAGAPAMDDRCACRRGQPRLSRVTAGRSRRQAQVSRETDARTHVNRSMCHARRAAGVQVTVAPARDNGRPVMDDGPRRPARRTGVSPQKGSVVMLAPVSVQRDGRRRPMRRAWLRAQHALRRGSHAARNPLRPCASHSPPPEKNDPTFPSACALDPRNRHRDAGKRRSRAPLTNERRRRGKPSRMVRDPMRRPLLERRKSS
jgi:hypothetical protein